MTNMHSVMDKRDSSCMEWASLLQRAPLTFDRVHGEATLGDKRILITGAGGWIGSALTRQIASFAPQELVLLDASERNLYEVQQGLQGFDSAQSFHLGSVTQPAVLEEIFAGIDRKSSTMRLHSSMFRSWSRIPSPR